MYGSSSSRAPSHGDARVGPGGRNAGVQGGAPKAGASRVSPFGSSLPGRASHPPMPGAPRVGEAGRTATREQQLQRAKPQGGQQSGRAGAPELGPSRPPAVPQLALGPTPRPPWPAAPGGGEEAAGPGPAPPEEEGFAETVVDEDHPVVSFLREAGLRQYAEILLQSGFDDMETLLDIEDVDMKDLGIPRGHAVKLRRRLREYRCPVAAPVPASYLGAGATSRFTPPTNKMTNAVEQSWEQVQAVGPENISELFYRNLFELEPELVEFFPPEVRIRHRDWSVDDSADESDLYDSPGLRKLFAKILSAVGAAVAGLHDINRLVPMLAQLGERHASIGIVEAHYHILGKALICALRSTLGEMFVPEVEFAWTMVYSFISAIMVGGALTTKRSDAPRPTLPAVGRDVTGGREVYRIERHLQKAIFGDVYEATGMTSGRSFAVKVLDRDTVQRFSNMQQQDHQFCESPLCEVRFVEMMRGLEHVAQLEDHFGDQYYHFVVSELATGGDLLEALRLRPGGFHEQHAQMLIREGAKGLASLHQRGLAMQDVSIENMLLYVLEDGQWQVRVCDPGQAVPFTVDPITGEEMPVSFHGFVAKEFRPPELYTKLEYVSTKIDAWCLGWSTFYLLAAQPMFHSADPSIDDPDYTLFSCRSYQRLFQQKGWRSTLSHQAKDFIIALMHPDPAQRMSVKQCLRHPWLAEGTLELPVGNARGRQVKAEQQSQPQESAGPHGMLLKVDSLDANSMGGQLEDPKSQGGGDIKSHSNFRLKMGKDEGDDNEASPAGPPPHGDQPTLLRKLHAKSRVAPQKDHKSLVARCRACGFEARTEQEALQGHRCPQGRRQPEASGSRP